MSFALKEAMDDMPPGAFECDEGPVPKQSAPINKGDIITSMSSAKGLRFSGGVTACSSIVEYPYSWFFVLIDCACTIFSRLFFHVAIIHPGSLYSRVGFFALILHITHQIGIVVEDFREISSQRVAIDE